MNAIHCHSLSKTYRNVPALIDLNLEIPTGSFYALLGPNGAGKSTAIKTLMNILRPTGGRAEVMGRDSRKLEAKDFTRIGYVSENQSLPKWMTIEYFLAYLKPFYPNWDDDRAKELLDMFELPPKRKIGQLSRGMWMKASLASSLAYRPSLLVMDEPFSGLDPVMRDDLIQGIADSAAQGDNPMTILVSSHDLAEIESLATHIGYIDHGRLRFSESMASLADRFREVEVTLEQPAPLPNPLPSAWLRPETSPSMVRFVDTAFHPEATPAEVNRVFPGVRAINANPIPLRSIFLTLARTGGKK
jgi:ABC-2 type transport system ATP-binding protein